MRSAAAAAVLAVSWSALADDDVDEAKQRGDDAAGLFLDAFGSPGQLNDKAMEPLSSEAQMSTADGTTFDAQVSCPAAQRFLSLTMLPHPEGDIDRLMVDIDSDMDGTADQSTTVPGPISGVCNNGLVRCTAGTFSGCSSYQWHDNGTGGIAMSAVPIENLGACYCINNSCGSGLLLLNAQKVLSDLGTGIARAMQAVYPRLNVGRSMIGSGGLAMVFYGQEAGCMSDDVPEQYFDHAGDLPAAGIAASSAPDSMRNMLLNSPAGQNAAVSNEECTDRRLFDLDSITSDEVIWSASYTEGGTLSCGTECQSFLTGRDGDNYLGPVSCGMRTDVHKLRVDHPDLIESATLTKALFDDWIRLSIDGVFVYNNPPTWTGAAPQCGENGMRTFGEPRTINQDLTAIFRSAAPGSELVVTQDVSWDHLGEGASWIEVETNESCAIVNEYTTDGCAGPAANANCTLKDEYVDGVQTYANYASTGLAPVAPTRDISEGGCEVAPVTRPWFEIKRVYTCDTGEEPYDMSAAEERAATISDSFDSETGDFTDRRLNPDGTFTTSSEALSLPPPDPHGGECTPVCKARLPATGATVTAMGAASDLNHNPVPWDYSYHECSADGVCPLESGETMVESCGCRDAFAEAMTGMQTIRMMQDDMICTTSE